MENRILSNKVENGLHIITTEFKGSKVINEASYSYFLNEGNKITERLTLKFTNGQVVEYYTYSLDIKLENLFLEMYSCESVGKFWHKKIKDKLEYKILVKTNV